MRAEGIFWTVECQIKTKFEKLLCNQGAIVGVTSKTSKLIKHDRLVASTFAH